jgi:hypothetical protein
MSDLLLPQQGARPWVPAENVKVGEVLNRYNIPLTGLVEQGESTYLYVCLFGEIEPLNIWAYSHVAGQELARLNTLVGAELSDAIDQALMDRMLVVALASDHRLIDWVTLDAGAEGSIGIARRFLNSMHARMEATRKDVEGLESNRELAWSAS